MKCFKQYLIEDDGWFYRMSPESQAGYIKAHPNCKYAKQAKSELEKEQAKKEKPVKGILTDAKIKEFEDQIKSIQDELNSVSKEAKEALTEFKKAHDEYGKRFTAEISGKIPYGSDEYWAKSKEIADALNLQELGQRKAKLSIQESALRQAKSKIELQYSRAKTKSNFIKRQISGTTDTSHPNIAKYIDFHGMSEESEKAIIEGISSNLERYPIMKGHFDFIGSHKSDKFKEVLLEHERNVLADVIQSEYNDNQRAIDEYLLKYNRKNNTNLSANDLYRAYIEDRTQFEHDDYFHKIFGKLFKNQSIDAAGGVKAYAQTRSVKVTRRLSSRSWAYYSSDNVYNPDNRKGMICFNENTFDQADLERNVESKWHPVGCNTKKSVLDHEFGHSLWYRLNLNKIVGFKEKPLQQYIRKIMARGYDHTKENLSGYAATNSTEFFAEAFAEYINNPEPREIAKEVGRLLEEEIKSRGL